MKFEKALRVHGDAINANIRQLFDDNIARTRGFIHDSYLSLKEFVLRGGKRLRPLLAIMAHQAVSDQSAGEIHWPAVGLELFHNSSLIHDDIMDEDSKRRGMSSMHSLFEAWFLHNHKEQSTRGAIFHSSSTRFGASMAILQGNILYALTARCFTRSNFPRKSVSEALDIINKTYREINEGQMLDILLEREKTIGEEHYLEMIDKKTAVLFVAAVHVGALFGKATDNQMSSLCQYAENLGLAFQLQDDLLDISPGLKGHALGSDIKKGKSVILVIKALENANPGQEKVLRSALNNPEVQADSLAEAIRVLYTTGAVDYVKSLIRQKVEEGRSELAKAEFHREGLEFFEDFSSLLEQRSV